MVLDRKKVILIIAPGKVDSSAIGSEMMEYLSDFVDVIASNLDKPVETNLYHKADIIVVLGGDGTILSTVRDMGSCQKPVVGVNLGKLGFLAEFSIEEFKAQFKGIISTKIQCTKRMLLKCCINGPNREPFELLVVNEVALIAGPPYRILEASVAIQGEEPAVCLGDGLIVATPTGSTAYNLSAGGPILSPGVGSAVITSLAAHTLNFRSIVVDMDRPLILKCSKQRPGAKINLASGELPHSDAVVAIDGQVHIPVNSEDDVIISKADAFFHLQRNTTRSQWQVLSQKLHWGRLPEYQ